MWMAIVLLDGFRYIPISLLLVSRFFLLVEIEVIRKKMFNMPQRYKSKGLRLEGRFEHSS